MDTGQLSKPGGMPLGPSNRPAHNPLEEVAEGFERLFARHLVEEITKESFSSDDNSMGVGGSSRMVRHRIVDTLTETLTEERALGMADMVEHFWDGQVSRDPGGSQDTRDTTRNSNGGPRES